MTSACSGPSEGSEPLYQSASLYAAAADIVASTRYMADIIAKGRFNLEEMERKARLDFAGSSEAHDRLVYDFGVPFRVGHHILGSMARAHHYGEPAPDLRALIKAETGRDVDVDQGEIMDIVLGRRFWPTTFDFPELRKVHAELSAKAEAAVAASAGPGPVETSLAAVLASARAWLAGSEAAPRKGRKGKP